MTTATVQRLTWDTEFLGLGVGRLHAEMLSVAELQQLLTMAAGEGYRLVYWSVRPDDTVAGASAQAVGAFFADRKIRISQVIGDGPKHLPAGISRATELTPELRNLAVQASEHSRFRLDPGFAPDVAARLYTRWLERVATGELSREVLQYQSQPGSPPTGLLMMGVTADRAEMVMMAVDVSSRGQGIGRAFIEAARRLCRAWQLSELQLVTQANNPACRLYQREGFLTEFEEHVYHFWL